MSDTRRRQYLDAMGVETWLLRGRDHAERSGVDDPLSAGSGSPVADLPESGDEALARLAREVAGCTRCGLAKGRTQAVFDEGPSGAAWLFIGEGPGAEEDRQGLPFVGTAGRLLNEMLFALGLGREQVYIANIVKCRPPGNRDPSEQEIAACLPYLKQQVEAVGPQVIVTLGRVAAQTLLDSKQSMARLRGHLYRYADTAIPLVVTYHPAYLLRRPGDKRKTWEDLCLARSGLGV